MDNQLDALLKECFEAIDGNYMDVPEEMQIPHRFSRSFRRNMRRMIRQQYRGFSISKIPRQRRLSLTIAVTVLIFLSLATAAICGGRNLISGFFADFSIDNILVSNAFDENASGIIEEVYMPTWLPEGYELVEVSDVSEDSTYEYDYCNSHDCDHKEDISKHIRFIQCAKAYYMKNYDNEDGELVQITVNEYDGIKFDNEGKHCFVWSNEDYTFELLVQVEIDEKTLIKILKSVQKVE